MIDENILSIDQSISKCAVTIWNNNEPIYWDVFKSGGSECNGEFPNYQNLMMRS
jgi:hypothetical protein